jgi:GNAT superfamily N-acetyltransferase
MRIRQYEPPDVDRCRSLWAEMTQHHRDIYDDQSIGGDDPGLEFDKHLASVGPERVWVATIGEEIVGLVSLIQHDQEAEVEPIVVSSQHRGGGIGRDLLNHAVEEARALGALYVSVKPVARNEEAVCFFHKAGFRTLGHIQMFMWLGPSDPGKWRPGPELFGMPFDY